MDAQMICLRHAEAEPPNWDSADGTIVTDPPLTRRGRHQAKATTNLLMGKEPKKVFVSEALRSRQTGEIIASCLGAPIEVVSALAEASMGKTDQDPAIFDLRAQILRQWIVNDNLDDRLTDGESGHSVATRMKNALYDIATKCQGSPAVVVGHVASLTVGVSALCNNGPSLWNKPLPNAVPFALTLSSNRWHVKWPVYSER